MKRMLEKLKEQEERLAKEQQSYLCEGKIKLSPKINIEEKLRQGYITAEDYKKKGTIYLLTQESLDLFCGKVIFIKERTPQQ